MSLRARWLAVVVLITASAPLHANTPFEDLLGFKWCFQRERPFFQEVTTETKQTMKVMNQDIVQTQKQTYYYRWQLVKYDAAKKQWQVKQKIDAVKLTIDIGGQKTEYDSTKPPLAGNALVAALGGAMVGAEFTVWINAEGRVSTIEGGAAVINNLKKAQGAANPSLEAMFTDSALRAMVEQALPMVPPRPRGGAREWVKETDLDLGPIGGYTIKHTYSDAGREGKLDKIRVAPTFSYRGPAAGADAKGLPFAIKNADLKSSDSDGMIYLDPREGRVERSVLNVRLKGKMTISIGGTDTEVDLDQTQVTTVKTYDADPLKK